MAALGGLNAARSYGVPNLGWNRGTQASPLAQLGVPKSTRPSFEEMRRLEPEFDPTLPLAETGMRYALGDTAGAAGMGAATLGRTLGADPVTARYLGAGASGYAGKGPNGGGAGALNSMGQEAILSQLPDEQRNLGRLGMQLAGKTDIGKSLLNAPGDLYKSLAGSTPSTSSIPDLLGQSSGPMSFASPADGVQMIPSSNYSDLTSVYDGAMSTAPSAFPSSGMGFDFGDGVGSYGGYIGPALRMASGDVQGGIESGIGYAVGNYFLPGIGGPIGSAIATPVFNAAGQVVQGVGDVLGGVGDAVGGFVESVGDFVGGIFGGCYITTAVCKNSDKPDDCDELQTMRKWRDTWMEENHPEDIQAYYEVAPKVVAAVESRDDSDVIWDNLKYKYLLPTIDAVKSGDNEKAYEKYLDMVREAAHYATEEN